MESLCKIPKKYLEDLFTYDPHTGEVRWGNSILVKPGDRGGLIKNKTCRGKAKPPCATWNGIKVYGHHIALILSGFDVPIGHEVDHINRNPHDNRLCNLRVATKRQNRFNRCSPITPKHGYIGVRSYTTKMGITKYQGRVNAGDAIWFTDLYLDSRSAAMARDVLAISHHGEFAFLNFRRSHYWLSVGSSKNNRHA